MAADDKLGHFLFTICAIHCSMLDFAVGSPILFREWIRFFGIYLLEHTEAHIWVLSINRVFGKRMKLKNKKQKIAQTQKSENKVSKRTNIHEIMVHAKVAEVAYLFYNLYIYIYRYIFFCCCWTPRMRWKMFQWDFHFCPVGWVFGCCLLCLTALCSSMNNVIPFFSECFFSIPSWPPRCSICFCPRCK